MLKTSVRWIAFYLVVLSAPNISVAADFSVDSLVYEGAFRIPGGTYGASRMGFANGTFTVDPSGESFYVVGHGHHQAIAEFRIPELSKADKIEDLPMADPPIQPFSSVLRRVDGGNPQDINTITGLAVINGKLVINAAEYYDGSSSNTHTTLIMDDADDLAGSKVWGFFSLQGKHNAAGWMSPIPSAVNAEMGYDYVFGNASNLPINGRSSMGPSAFGVDVSDFDNPAELGGSIPTETWLNFSIDNQLHPDHYNRNGGNDLWTEVSYAYFGFFVPGSRNYLVFGASGGHEYGIGYKLEDTGAPCGGSCVKVASDVYNYYWLWDVDDLKSVKSGTMQPFEVRPLSYGKLSLEFSIPDSGKIPKTIIGAHYNYNNGKLYFLLGRADGLQSPYESIPIMLVYNIGLNRPGVPNNVQIR